jgi:L-threonylcarbamoyladenylate synthase
MSKILAVDSGVDAVSEAISVLSQGGLVIFPTDTVYGVGASVDRPDAVARLYVAKGRPLDRAIPVLVSSELAVERMVSELDDVARTLMRHFWPGPLTIVLPAATWLPSEIVRDTGSVGVRMPDHPIALEMIERSGGALATTSANNSGQPETRTAQDAASDIGARVELVVDGGESPGGVPSTVVKVSEDGNLTVLRKGAISEQDLLAVLGDQKAG